MATRTMDTYHTDREAHLRNLTVELQRIDPTKQYYQLSLTATPEGKLAWATYSHFVDFTDETRRFELREASIIKANRLAEFYQELGESYLVVNDEHSLHVFLMMGGHALIEESIAAKWLSDVIKPAPVARSGPLGFKSLAAVPRAELNRAPTRKQRLRVLKRDDFRCRICGERPADNVHIKLHIHHMRMWSRGGLTEDINLITVCETCHDGLEPHEDWSLIQLVPGASFPDHFDAEQRNHVEGVARYRELVRSIKTESAVLSADLPSTKQGFAGKSKGRRGAGRPRASSPSGITTVAS